MDTTAKQDIAELLARSAFALDHKDLQALQQTFTEDALFTLVIDGVPEPSVFEGRDAIMGLMKGALDDQTDLRRHVLSNLIFSETDGQGATVLSYLSLMATENGVTQLITTGLYTDQVAQQADGSWLITNRHLKLDRPY